MSVSFSAGERVLELIALGRVPESVARDAARGRLSLPFADRLLVLATLAAAPGPLQAEAQSTLAALDTAQVQAVLLDHDCPPVIRRHFADTDGNDPLSQEAQELLRLAETERSAFELVEPDEQEQAALAAESAPPSPAPSVDAAAASLKPKAESLLTRVAKMSVPQRVQLALKGSRDERLLLIRDSNKVVQRAVVTSPRVTDNDIELIAAMRNVSDEVLRMIAGSRRYMQSMPIIRNLVNNPRTPLDTALALSKHLFINDLKLLVANKNVGETLRRAAARQVRQKQDRGS